METAKDETKIITALLKNLNNARGKYEEYDFILKCKNDVNIPAHKCVLASASSFFANMFDSSMKECNENCVVFAQFTGENLENIINYIYTEGNEINLTEENVKEILDMALYFNLGNLIKTCTNFLIDLLTKDNFHDLLEYGITLIDNDLPKACCEWILKNFESIQCSENLQKISFECMQFLVKINKNERTSDLEEILHRIVINWIEFDLETRLVNIEHLIEHLNYGNMSKKFLLSDKVMEHEILMKDKSFLSKMLTLTKRLIYLPFNQNSYALTSTSIFEIKINSEEHDEKLSYVNSLVFPQNRCYFARTNFDYTTFGNRNIFVCGGTLDSKGYSGFNTTSCESYSFETNSWTTLSSSGIASGKLAALNHKIYQIYQNTDGRSYYKYFDSLTGGWSSSNTCPYNFSPTKLCLLNGCFYVVCHYNLYGFIPSENSWKHISKYSNESFSEAVAYDNNLYCFNKNGYCIFDTRMNRWLNNITLYKENLKNTERNWFSNTGECTYDGSSNTWHIKSKTYSKEFNRESNERKACLLNDEIYISDGNQIQIYKAHDFSFCRQFSISIPGLEGLISF